MINPAPTRLVLPRGTCCQGPRASMHRLSGGSRCASATSTTTPASTSSPPRRRPYPWINYLGTEEFFGLISHTGGGYCFYRDARLRRLTRYRYNNVPTDVGGRYYFIHDGGDFWTPGWAPVKRELDRFECRHGLSYTQITGERNGLRAEVLHFVPLGTNAEVHRVTLKNLGDDNEAGEALLLRRVLPLERLGRPDQLPAQPLHRRGRGRRQRRSTTRRSTGSGATTTPSTASTRPWPASTPTARASSASGTAGASRRSWPRASPGTPWPAAGPRSARTSWRWTSAPGEEKDVRLRPRLHREPGRGEVGVARRRQQDAGAKALLSRFETSAQVDAALAEIRDYWTGMLSKYTVQTGDPRLDRMVNIWNPYQCMVTFNMSRCASYFETGIGRGMGFRDSNQDLLGFVHLVPARARERILDIAATQFPDGSAYHQYQPLTKRGNNDVGLRLQRRPALAHRGRGGLHQGDRGPGDPEGGGALRQRPGEHGHALRAPQALLPPRPGQPRTPRPAPHRPGGLERLPQPQLLLGAARTSPSRPRATGSARPPSRSSSPGSSSTRPPTTPTSPRPWASPTRPEAAREAADADGARSSSSTAGTASGSCGPTTSSGKKVGSKECEEGQIFIESQGYCVMAGIGVADRPGAEGARLGPGRAWRRPTASCCTSRPTRATTSSSARSAPTRRATRRTPASSATTTRG